MGELPFITILNKADLEDKWDIDLETVESFEKMGYEILMGSAKTGLGVEKAFELLTKRMLED